jgi:hypothetical protein
MQNKATNHQTLAAGLLPALAAINPTLSTAPDAATLERWLESNASPAPPRLDAGPVALFAFLLWR